MRWAETVARLRGLIILVGGGGAVLAMGFATASLAAASSFIQDDARIIRPQAEAQLAEKLARLQNDTGAQVSIVTMTDLDGRKIETVADDLARRRSLGPDAALLVVAPHERKARLWVGQTLAPVLTDAFAASVLQDQVLPAFRVGGYIRGFRTAVDRLDERLRLPREAAAHAALMDRPRPAPAPLGPMILVVAAFGFLMLGLARQARADGRRRPSATGPILTWSMADADRDGARRRAPRLGPDDFSGGGGSGGW